MEMEIRLRSTEFFVMLKLMDEKNEWCFISFHIKISRPYQSYLLVKHFYSKFICVYLIRVGSEVERNKIYR
jgi:hypothetical protein